MARSHSWQQTVSRWQEVCFLGYRKWWRLSGEHSTHHTRGSWSIACPDTSVSGCCLVSMSTAPFAWIPSRDGLPHVSCAQPAHYRRQIEHCTWFLGLPALDHRYEQGLWNLWDWLQSNGQWSSWDLLMYLDRPRMPNAAVYLATWAWRGQLCLPDHLS